VNCEHDPNHCMYMIKFSKIDEQVSIPSLEAP
jgi:hypothetical protein